MGVPLGPLRQLNARILALVLILVFTQKLGLGIWMHNWLHETRVLKGRLSPDVDKVAAGCHCIDDFLVPLVGAPVVDVPAPLREFHLLPCVYCTSLYTVPSSFASLRGPPSVAVSC